MAPTKSRCRIVLGCGNQDPDPAALPARERYRSVHVRREAWRASSAGETLLVFTARNALVGWNESTAFDDAVPVPDEIPDLTLRVCGPLGAHDEAVFIRPPSAPAGAELAPGDGLARAVEPWESILVTAAERVAVPLVVRDPEHRAVVVAYCSRRKNEAPGDLPAIERYASPRLRAAEDLATRTGAAFLILSGRYGLLRAEDPIPHYDHLLRPDEVPGMIERVIPGLGVFDEVIFTQAAGDYVEPYLAVIAGAAAATATTVREEIVG